MQGTKHDCPNAQYDAYTGYAPRLGTRDLVLDLYDALSPQGIKLMLYWTGDGPHFDQQVFHCYKCSSTQEGLDGRELACCPGRPSQDLVGQRPRAAV